MQKRQQHEDSRERHAATNPRLQQSQEAGKVRSRVPLEPNEGVWLSSHLDFGPVAFRNRRK
jgi:hypothetical protein